MTQEQKHINEILEIIEPILDMSIASIVFMPIIVKLIDKIKEISAGQVEPEVILPKPNPACENCKYYQDVSNGWGYCKFNPPYIRKEQRYKTFDFGKNEELVEDICHKEWVHTNNYDWCGQFEQREA